jgi:hypothetical protein
MNEAELRNEIASMRNMIAALSGRIDGMDRGEILRAVKDGRRDKLAERHAQAFASHAADSVPHTYRDYMNPHRIPGAVEVRPYEDAAGAFETDIATLRWDYETAAAGSGTVPFDTVEKETNSAVIDADATGHKLIIKRAGRYLILASVELRATRTSGSTYWASSASASLRSSVNSEVRTGVLKDQAVFTSGVVDNGGYTQGTVFMAYPAVCAVDEEWTVTYVGTIIESGNGAGTTYLSAIALP